MEYYYSNHCMRCYMHLWCNFSVVLLLVIATGGNWARRVWLICCLLLGRPCATAIPLLTSALHYIMLCSILCALCNISLLVLNTVFHFVTLCWNAFQHNAGFVYNFSIYLDALQQIVMNSEFWCVSLHLSALLHCTACTMFTPLIGMQCIQM